MKYQIYNTTQERVIGYDSLLTALAKSRVVTINKIDPTGNSAYFTIVEGGSDYYSLTLTRTELQALGEELIGLSKS